MPVLQPPKVDSSQPSVYRRRRHTITRPDSALELLSLSDSDDGDQDDQTLDRISGILSNLIQEANEAVQNNGSSTRKATPLIKPRPRSAMLRSAPPIHSTPTSRPKSILSLSRLPRPIWSGHHQPRTHDRQSSISSSASSSSLFSPAPATESPITASSVDQAHYFLDQDGIIREAPSVKRQSSFGTTDLVTDSILDHADRTDQDISPFDETQQPHDSYYDTVGLEQQELAPASTQLAPQTIQHRLENPLMESFRRLDSSMAMVESLSRDLAKQDDDDDDDDHEGLLARATPTSRLTLLLLPLLHIPHALITTVFDTLISPGNTTTSTMAWKTPSSLTNSSPLSGIMAWTICFALANMVVTWSGVPTPHWFIPQQQQQQQQPARPRRLSLPGSYHDAQRIMIRSKRPAPINTTLITKKPARRTPIKRSARKRVSSKHQSAQMTTSHSNDRSYTLAIQRSREQQVLPPPPRRRNSF